MVRLWKDNPYKTMGPLGYRWYAGEELGGLSPGLHFDAHPTGLDADADPAMELWITVAKA